MAQDAIASCANNFCIKLKKVLVFVLVFVIFLYLCSRNWFLPLLA